MTKIYTGLAVNPRWWRLLIGQSIFIDHWHPIGEFLAASLAVEDAPVVRAPGYPLEALHFVIRATNRLVGNPLFTLTPAAPLLTAQTYGFSLGRVIVLKVTMFDVALLVFTHFLRGSMKLLSNYLGYELPQEPPRKAVH